VQTTAGPIQAILPPPIIDGYEQPMGAVPGLGEHTDALLAELGLSGNEISRLREQGVVA
jgi:crotonobetainyl-CoA:carnitine CoA-transferase CaiB-like acyl-CoA transferase